ncbi:hypothetical protein [Pseudomonas sp.]|uniref:hypothetical protein n=1 Tax=Pseudomonas sp. TaxID=306 RepID=UPI00258F5C0D|nr:hypothetical protein [Pseudomonas sp.]
MASEVDICNLALAHLGDTATVSSINPPEGSAQAEHCARFYPIARDSLLEMHTWGFATTRVTLASIGSSWPEWKYCYAAPSDMLNALGILDPYASDDYAAGNNYGFTQTGVPLIGSGTYTPQPFAMESLPDGTPVIYTNQDGAVLRYTRTVTDTTLFSPLFIDALGWSLASYLAGPLIKGDAGAAEAKRCYAAFQLAFGKAAVSDANQRRTQVSQNVAWVAGR